MSVQELGNEFSDGNVKKEIRGGKNNFPREKFASERKGNWDIEGRLRGESEGREESEERGREEGRRRGYWDDLADMRSRREVDYEVEYASPLTDESCIPLSPIEERYLSPCPELDEYPGRNNATLIILSL